MWIFFNINTRMKNERQFFLFTKKPDLYKTFQSNLSQEGWQVYIVQGTKELDALIKNDKTTLVCLGFLQPFVELDGADLERIWKSCQSKNPLFVAASENGERGESTSLNRLLDRYGIRFNDDCIIRPNPYKLHHPKVAMLEDFIANSGLSQRLGKYLKLQQSNMEDAGGDEILMIGADSRGLKACGPRFLYANGCSIRVEKPAIAMMTSSRWALPSKQAICAVYQDDEQKILTLGSSDSLSDGFINEEDNNAIVSSLISFLEPDNFPINTSDAKTLEIPEPINGPEVESLIELPIACLEDIEPLPENKMDLIDRKPFKLDTSKLPLIIEAYKELKVEHEPLGLIEPKLFVEKLKFEPAVYKFVIRRKIEIPKDE